MKSMKNRFRKALTLSGAVLALALATPASTPARYDLNGVSLLVASPDPQDAEPCSAAERLKQELATVGVERFTAPNYKPGLIRHIVLFRYNEAVSSEQREDVIRRFLALRTLAKRKGRPYILSIETGSNISGEGLDQCFEQGFIVTFKSQGDRNYYAGQPVVTDPSFYDPDHQAFKDFLGPLLDQNGALVFDFSVGK
jgi:hypothetical protein